MYVITVDIVKIQLSLISPIIGNKVILYLAIFL